MASPLVPQPRPVVVGTRGSPLALWQAEHVVAQLRLRHPDRRFVVQTIRTQGDRTQGDAQPTGVLTGAPPVVGAFVVGAFVKEIQSALLAGEIDLAVHSLKDLPSSVGAAAPAQAPAGTALAATCAREDPRDALVTRHGGLAALPTGARLGTTSPRRAALLRSLRPDLVVVPIRGNVDSRVRKALDPAAGYDGVVLAVAGLLRLGLAAQIAERFPLDVLVPAPGQGIVGVEARSDDADALALAAEIDDRPTHLAARAERAFVRAVGGGCTTPLGAYATLRDGLVGIAGVLASPDGRQVLRAEAAASAAEPEAAGEQLAAALLAAGGAAILAAAERAASPALGDGP